jgi:uncharacterized protein
MFKYIFVGILLSNLIGTKSLSQTDKLRPSIDVTLEGYIGQTLNDNYKNEMLLQDVDHLVAPFKNRMETTMWQSEFWGKWFTSAILAYKYKPTKALEIKMKSAIDSLIATQSADGYIGNYKIQNHLQQWDIWGRKYVMLGLIDYFELKKYDKAIDAAQKVADHLILEIENSDGSIVNKGNYRGMAASSVLEPMVRLYNVTKKVKYLEFSKEIVRQWELENGPKLISKSSIAVANRFPKSKKWYSWEQGQKAYEMMSCYEGLLELYRTTGDPIYIKAVESTWLNIKDNEINLAGSGAAMEMWFGGKHKQHQPVKHYQETCVTVTWIKLNQQLLRLTGESKYADEIEKSYYNALLGALSNEGQDWAKYTPLNGQRLKGSGQCGMHLNCCDASGPRGLYTLPLTSVMQSNSGLNINFFVGGTYNLLSPKQQKISTKIKTEYPTSGKVIIYFDLPQKEIMDINLRIPQWSKTNSIFVNSMSIDSIQEGKYELIRREWKSGDSIVLDLDMEGRLEKQEGYIAVLAGPLLLAREYMFENENFMLDLDPLEIKSNRIELTKVISKDSKAWVVYEAKFTPDAYTEGPVKPIKIKLCDYASAGNIKPLSYFRAWWPMLINPSKN